MFSYAVTGCLNFILNVVENHGSFLRNKTISCLFYKNYLQQFEKELQERVKTGRIEKG